MKKHLLVSTKGCGGFARLHEVAFEQWEVDWSAQLGDTTGTTVVDGAKY